MLLDPEIERKRIYFLVLVCSNSGSDNEIFSSDNGYYNFIFQSNTANVQSQAGVRTGVWYHYCMCWDYTSSTADIYHNGRKTGSISTPSGRRLTSNGNLVLGQDQDSVGGTFDLNQVFGGELQKLNMFSKKLSSSEVNEMLGQGNNVIKYRFRELIPKNVIPLPRYSFRSLELPPKFAAIFEVKNAIFGPRPFGPWENLWFSLGKE